MRTSGGGREIWMTALPLGFLIVFLVFSAGGPKPFLKILEGALQSPLEWFRDLFR
jgi:hypothetical protein